mmetsp:Transcript_35095/g.98955  ORF Transcript_35095/g.98955 Transcript_35095/m.98955 type:complete len:151 (-) Transcript_35095:226-678(-)
MAGHREKPLKAGFAKLVGVHGLDLDYTIQKYEVILGRRSKSTQCDVILGDSMSISRVHAKIAYNFSKRMWELTVPGKNGLYINRVLYTPDSQPAILTTCSLLEIGAGDGTGTVTIMFLLPVEEEDEPARRRDWAAQMQGKASRKRQRVMA